MWKNMIVTDVDAQSSFVRSASTFANVYSQQAQSKEAGSSAGDITQKQKGLSTTDSKHSLQIDQDPTKSQKGSGGPETAKAKGTVDSFAPVKGVGKSS